MSIQLFNSVLAAVSDGSKRQWNQAEKQYLRTTDEVFLLEGLLNLSKFSTNWCHENIKFISALNIQVTEIEAPF
ncbi:MAG: hypothetical protein KME59_18575 [Trichormus sp. ATA11-4-KO1]|jgi:hypothetical protein|nr:hypothetical protein [Trichormus sp. ATA11-4-KO1]